MESIRCAERVAGELFDVHADRSLNKNRAYRFEVPMPVTACKVQLHTALPIHFCSMFVRLKVLSESFIILYIDTRNLI